MRAQHVMSYLLIQVPWVQYLYAVYFLIFASSEIHETERAFRHGLAEQKKKICPQIPGVPEMSLVSGVQSSGVSLKVERGGGVIVPLIKNNTKRKLVSCQHKPFLDNFSGVTFLDIIVIDKTLQPYSTNNLFYT